MSRLLELLIAFVIVLALFLGFALFLPSHGRVERRAEIPNPPSQVFDFLNQHRKHTEWSSWAGLDKFAKWKLEGESEGQGARIAWTSFEKSLGNGSIEIVKSVPNEELVYKLENNWSGTEKTSTFKLEQNPKTNATELTWSIDVNYGWNLFARFAGLYLNGGVGEFMSSGLNKMTNLMSTFPVSDYSQYQVEMLDLPERDFLYIGKSISAKPSQWRESEEAIYQAVTDINAVISANALTASGLPLASVNVLGEENHDINVGVPIATGSVVTPTGDIRLGKLPATKAIKVIYPKSRSTLHKARELAKAYAMAHGYEFNFDLSGIQEEIDNTGTGLITNVYLPIVSP